MTCEPCFFRISNSLATLAGLLNLKKIDSIVCVCVCRCGFYHLIVTCGLFWLDGNYSCDLYVGDIRWRIRVTGLWRKIHPQHHTP